MAELFEQLREGGEAEIHRLVEERQQEYVQLEFKRKSDSSHGSFNDDDKRTLGEALSGFSNSAGGLLIWGIDARKGDDGIDCAQAVQPISEIAKFRAQATTLIGQFLMPRHDGIRVESVTCSEDASKGYLLVEVDRSERRPHRSEAKGKKGYYKRVGDSFFEMEHYDIEDAFKRFGSPKISVRWSKELAVTSPGERTYRLNVALHNESSTSARYPYLNISELVHAHYSNLIKPSLEGRWRCYYGQEPRIIHSGQTITMAALGFTVRWTDGITDARIGNLPLAIAYLAFRFQSGCENARMIEGSMQIPGLELLGDDLLHGKD